MVQKPVSFRPKSRRFKSPEKRAAFFRDISHRTDRKARHNRRLIALDAQRIAASGYGQQP